MPASFSRADNRVADRTRASRSRGLTTSLAAQQMPAAQQSHCQANMVSGANQDQLGAANLLQDNFLFAAQQQQVARPLHFGEHATANAQFIQPGQLEARPNNSPQHFVHPNMHIGEDNAALSTPCVSPRFRSFVEAQGQALML